MKGALSVPRRGTQAGIVAAVQSCRTDKAPDGVSVTPNNDAELNGASDKGGDCGQEADDEERS